jgi:hypothetical protein
MGVQSDRSDCTVSAFSFASVPAVGGILSSLGFVLEVDGPYLELG